MHVAHNNTSPPNNTNNVKCGDSILWPKIYLYVYCHSIDPKFRPLSMGIYQVRNEIETKQNETKSTKAKRSQRKQNEIDWYEENGREKK